MAQTNCDDCGQPFPIYPPNHSGGTGYANCSDGKRVCYPCADVRERADLAASDRFFAYIGSDGRTITTWTGGELLRVVSSNVRRMDGFGGSHERTFFRAVAPDGSRWYGSGPGRGMYARLRRAKAAR